MHTIQDLIKLSTEHLQKHQIANPRRQAEELIADVLNMKRLDLYLNFEKPVEKPEVDKIRAALVRRSKGEPLQYIQGKVSFLDCTIHVSPHVLIPRQETEILADKIVNTLQQQNLDGKQLWDVCCGSGCIGIALKKKFPNLSVTLADISPEALKIAKENARENLVSIDFVQGNLLEPFLGKQVDFFVCNPPYVTENEYAGLDREVRDFEPKQALVSGPTGLECYQVLAQQLKPILKPNGLAWFEIGTGQGQAILEIFKGQGWTKLVLEKDWAGHDRFFFLENE